MVGYGGKDLQERKVLSLEWKSKGVMDDESGESMELMDHVIVRDQHFSLSVCCVSVCPWLLVYRVGQKVGP